MLVALTVAAVAVTGVGAVPLDAAAPGLSKEEIRQLGAGDAVMRYPDSARSLQYLPIGLAAESMKTLSEGFSPSVFVERAFLARGRSLSGKGALEIANALLDVPTISGVTYYSERKQGITVLFDDVFRVEGPGSMKKVQAPPLASLPASMSMHLHLKDSNFGSSWYALHLDQRAGGLFLRLENSRPLNFTLIRAFGPAEVRMGVVMIPVDEGLYVAAFCAADPASIASSMVDMKSAMEKRLRAIQGWAVDRIGTVPR